MPGSTGAVTLRAGAGLLRRAAGAWRGRDGQGHRRRGRARHACGAPCGRTGRGACTLHVGGARRPSVSRACTWSALMPRRAPVEVQVLGDGQARGKPRRARMHPAAALPEAGRDRARPALPGAAARAVTQAALRMARAVGYRRPWYLRVPGRRGVGHAALGVHRGQPAAAGGAHGDRGGHGPRSGPVADRAWLAAPVAGRAGRRADGTAAQRGFAHAVAHQCRDARCAGQRPSIRRHAWRASICPPARRARRHAWLRGPRALAALRHAAGQARSCTAPRPILRMRCAAAARAGRMPHRGPGDQPAAAARHRRAA